jgi:hypothetical protein
MFEKVAGFAFANRLFGAMLFASLGMSSVAEAGMTIGGKPKVSFFAVGSPSFLNIEGDTTTMTLVDDGTKLTFSVPMATVDSGVALRDEHMNNNYIHIEQFPNVILAFNKADVSWPTDMGRSVQGTVKASFEVHGVPAPTDVTYTVTRTKTGYRVKGKFDYDCTQHGIHIESYMGVTIDPKMYATVTVDLVDAP